MCIRSSKRNLVLLCVCCAKESGCHLYLLLLCTGAGALPGAGGIPGVGGLLPGAGGIPGVPGAAGIAGKFACSDQLLCLWDGQSSASVL